MNFSAFPLGGSSGAPSTATYFTAGDETGTLPNSVSFGLLASGVLKQTVAGAVSTPSISAPLTSIDGLTTAADKMIYTTGANVYAVTDLTSFARTLLDDANAAAARTTLGLGTMATQAASAVAITGGTIAGATATTFTFTSGSIGTAVTCTTQTANDNSTKLASTAYVDQSVNETQTDTAASSNTTFTLVEATSNYHKVTFTSDCTLAFTFTAGKVQSMAIQLINAGAYTVTLPTILWAGGTAPTFTSSGTDVIVVWHNGDNVVYGALIGADMS